MRPKPRAGNGRVKIGHCDRQHRKAEELQGPGSHRERRRQREHADCDKPNADRHASEISGPTPYQRILSRRTVLFHAPISR